MTIDLQVHNAYAKVVTDPGVIQGLRRLVAYQQTKLPSVAAQSIIKSFFSARKRWGGEKDVARLYRSDDVREELEAAGLPEDECSPRIIDQILRQKGVWDGWTPLVDPDGRFQTGHLTHVVRALELRMQLPYYVTDHRVWSPPEGPFLGRPDPGLFPFQQEAVESFLAKGRGVVVLPPRAGKTRIAAEIVNRLGLPTLFVVPGIGLVEQTIAAFIRAGWPASSLFGLHGGVKRVARQMNAALVWVSTAATAASLDLRSRKVLVIDEFHHAVADTWQVVSGACTEACWRLGLTGTNYRADGTDTILRGVLAETVFERSVGEMVAVGRLAPARIAMLRTPSEALDADTFKGRDAYRYGVAGHPARNQTLAWAAHELATRGKRVLVLTKEVQHSVALSEGIRIWGHRVVQVDGTKGSAGAEAVRLALQDLHDHKIDVVVGTGVIGEGRDVPAADALVYAAGGRSRVKVVQDFYRVLTAHEGKRYGVVVDAADDHHPTLVDAAADRLAIYRREAAFTAEVMDPLDLRGWLDRVDAA